jgi:hypothetical protein
VDAISLFAYSCPSVLSAVILPIIFLIGRKSTINIENRPDFKLYALDRPYWHIVADFLYYISIAASLSTLVFIWTRDIQLIDNKLDVPSHTLILLVNFLLYGISMFMYSLYAKRERVKDES